MGKVDKAVQYFEEGFNCSQSVFAAIVENSGIEKESALKIAAGFGGGIALMQKTCGAVTGAVMALGYLNGHSSPDDDVRKEKVYEQVQVFVKHFTEKHGTVKCSELLGCSLESPGDRQKAKELKLFETVCRKCVSDAVNILEEITRNPESASSHNA